MLPQNVGHVELAEYAVEAHLEISSAACGQFTESMAAVPSLWDANLQYCPWATGSKMVNIVFQFNSTWDVYLHKDFNRLYCKDLGIRPGKGDCAAATKSSELALVTVLSTCLHFPFHRLWAFSNALDKCFLHFRQVRWCLVSALACKNAQPHGHTHSEDLEAKASLSPNWGWCSIMTIRSLWMALGGGLREEVQLAFKLKVSY